MYKRDGIWLLSPYKPPPSTVLHHQIPLVSPSVRTPGNDNGKSNRRRRQQHGFGRLAHVCRARRRPAATPRHSCAAIRCLVPSRFPSAAGEDLLSAGRRTECGRARRQSCPRQRELLRLVTGKASTVYPTPRSIDLTYTHL